MSSLVLGIMKVISLVIFVILNFGALGLGAYLMNGETTGEWYSNLNKAPWTPPGWVFGAAWFSIMLFFSVYMWRMFEKIQSKNKKAFLTFYTIQLVLNIMWNPIFFGWHLMSLGLIVISILAIFILYFMIKGFKMNWYLGLLILPYFIWMCVATSLNVYTVLHN